MRINRILCVLLHADIQLMTEDPDTLHQKLACIMQWKSIILKNNILFDKRMEWTQITVSSEKSEQIFWKMV